MATVAGRGERARKDTPKKSLAATSTPSDQEIRLLDFVEIPLPVFPGLRLGSRHARRRSADAFAEMPNDDEDRCEVSLPLVSKIPPGNRSRPTLVRALRGAI